MCGIVGIFNYSARPEDEADRLVRMRDAMVHRGPDDAGLYASPDQRVWLGHRRLSIVDLSPAGHQPMSNEDGTVWIAFNGEIYNQADLREELIRQGHTFRSRSDTEAIVHLYEELGPECVARLDGMFAFAIWDERRRRLLLARDRLGKKPLYWALFAGRLLFASEIKALLAHPAVPRELDLQALDLYLTFADVPPPRTLFGGIAKLPAAHRLICTEHGQVETARYWSPAAGIWPREVRKEECVERVRYLVREAVRKRLMSDVPIGAFLSGGVDSSTNVALMSQLSSEPLRTFSVGFAGFAETQNFHDLPYARRVAERFGCRHEEVIITETECKQYLMDLVHGQDEPIGDPACLPMHFVSRAAKQGGVTVVLVGEGSDEVFGGYEDFAQIVSRAAVRWRRLRRLPRLLRGALYHGSRLAKAPPGRIDVLRRAYVDEPLYFGLDVVFWDVEKRDLYRREKQPLLLRGGAADTVRGYYDDLLRQQPAADVLQQMSYIELQNRLPELLLMRVDKFSMAHSLEARAPFLDYQLTTYALSLPQRLKIRGQVGKHVLKQAVRPFLPAEVIDRPKQGFRVPLPAWLAGDLSGWAEELLFASPLRRLGLFNFDYISTLWQRHRQGVADHSFDLWCLINLAAWHAHWIDSR